MAACQSRTLSFLHMISQSICQARVRMQYGDSRSSRHWFFRILNTVSATDAEFLESSSLSIKRRSSNGPFGEVERLVDKHERNGTVSCPA